MKKKARAGWSSLWVALTVALIAITSLALYRVLQRPSDKFSRMYSGKSNREEIPSSGPRVSTAAKSSVESSDVSLLDELSLWTPEIQWTDLQPDTWQYYQTDSQRRFIGYETVYGFSRSSAVASVGLPGYFDEINERLKLMAWHENPYLAGTGPDGTVLGYEKVQNGKRRIFVLWSRLRSCRGANEKPCYEETAFYSDAF